MRKIKFCPILITLFFVIGLTITPTINAYTIKIGTSNNKNSQSLPIKTNDAITFKKTYNNLLNDQANSVKQTFDGGYILVGSSESDVESERIWIVKTDYAGNQEWNITYQKDGMKSIANDVEQTDDGYVIVGSCGYYLVDTPLVVKISENGNIEWARTYDNYAGYQGAKSICKTTYGTFVFTGALERYEEEYYIIYLCEIDAYGNVLWKKNYEYGKSYDVEQTSDGYVIVGESESEDVCLIKTDEQGNKEWSKLYDYNNNTDFGCSVKQTIDGGYIIAGCTLSVDEKYQKGWVIKTDSAGNIIWDRKFGADDGASIAYDICKTKDGGFVATGYKGDAYSYWNELVIIKYASDGYKEWEKKYSKNDFNGGASIQETNDGGLIIGGFTGSYHGTDFDYWLIKTDENGDVDKGRQIPRYHHFLDIINLFLQKLHSIKK